MSAIGDALALTLLVFLGMLVFGRVSVERCADGIGCSVEAGCSSSPGCSGLQVRCRRGEP